MMPMSYTTINKYVLLTSYIIALSYKYLKITCTRGLQNNPRNKQTKQNKKSNMKYTDRLMLEKLHYLEYQTGISLVTTLFQISVSGLLPFHMLNFLMDLSTFHF